MRQYQISTLNLSICRIVFCISVILFIGLRSYSWMSNELNIFFDAPHLSFAALIGSFPSHTFFVLLSIASLLSFVAMFIGYQAKVTSIVFSITSIVGHNFYYSFGKIDHSLLWLLTPIFLSLAGWGNHFTLFKTRRAEEKDNSLYITLLAICIGFSMFTSGIQKIAGGWLSWEAEAVRFHLTRNIFAFGRAELLADYFLKISSHLIWKFFDYSALVLEIGFLISILNKRYFQLFVVMGVLFHTLVLLMFNIVFYSNLFAYLVFLNWNQVFNLIGLNVSLVNTKLVQNTKRIMYSGTLVCVGWLVYQILNPTTFRLPALIDVISNDPDGNSHIAIYLLYVLAFLTVILAVVASLKSSRKYANNLEDMPMSAQRS